jgi:hypothetical protein
MNVSINEIAALGRILDAVGISGCAEFAEACEKGGENDALVSAVGMKASELEFYAELARRIAQIGYDSMAAMLMFFELSGFDDPKEVYAAYLSQGRNISLLADMTGMDKDGPAMRSCMEGICAILGESVLAEMEKDYADMAALPFSMGLLPPEQIGETGENPSVEPGNKGKG